MAQGFYTDDMTVNDILNMSWQELHSLDTRDMSRALRTVSLAANKRINRLMKQVKKTKDGYVPKQSAKHNIAVDAINAVTQDGKKKIKWGVKEASTRNEMIEQINDIRKFMNMKTSTISGAKAVRKAREQRLFGKTREQAGRGKTVREKARIAKKYAAAASSAYAVFRKFLEHEGIPNNPYQNFGGSDVILNLIGNKIESSGSEEEALEAALQRHNEQYIQEQEEYLEAVKDKDFWDMLSSGWDNE